MVPLPVQALDPCWGGGGWAEVGGASWELDVDGSVQAAPFKSENGVVIS